MPHPNEDLIKRGLDALAKGDLDAFVAVHAEDAVVHVPGKNRWAGEHRGHEAIRALYGGQGEALAGSSPDLGAHDLLVNDDHGVLLQTYRAERDGRSLSDNGVVVFHFRDGKIGDVWVHPQDQYANDEFWDQA